MCDKNGQSALELAIDASSSKSVKYLLEGGASIDIPNSALELALQSGQTFQEMELESASYKNLRAENIKIIRSLLKFGALITEDFYAKYSQFRRVELLNMRRRINFHTRNLKFLPGLISLNLSNISLKEFPTELSYLANLTSLTMNGNFIERLDPVLLELPNLKQLSISQNRISSLPEWLCDLIFLEVNLCSFLHKKCF